jgi:hypothetical protein
MPYFLAKASQAVTCLCHLGSAALLPALPRFPVGGGGCGCGGGAVDCAGAGCGVGWGGRRFLVPPTSSPLPLCELSAALVRGLASLDPLPPGLLDLRPELGTLPIEVIFFLTVAARPRSDLSRGVVEQLLRRELLLRPSRSDIAAVALALKFDKLLLRSIVF